MMASTMAIPQLAALPNFHGSMPNQIPGTIPGSVPGAIPGAYQGHVPVSLQAAVMSGPIVNGTNSPSANMSPPIQTLRVPVVPVGGGCYNDGMEVVWHGEFSRLFSSFFPPHVWYLSITNSAPQEKWKFYRDSAKVRFCCQDCGNGWTSMKGRVTFWFHLNMATSEGFVQFKLYGQVCKKCNSGKFEYVMWYPEEVSKVMCNLYNKVGQTFYGFMQPPIRIDRRPGRPRNQHNADLCQACRDGECDQGRPVKALYNYIPSTINQSPRPTNQPMPPRSQVPPNPLTQVNPPLPVVIRQPPVPPPGHIVIQSQINAPASMAGPVVSGSHSGPPLITPPVTLTSGAQPILTYSIVTGPAKESAKLTPISEPFNPSTTVPANAILANRAHIQPTKPQYALPSSGAAASTIVAQGKPTAVLTKAPLANGTAQCAIDAAKPVANVPQVSTSTKSPDKPTKPQKITSIQTIAEEKSHIKSNGSVINGYAAAAEGKLVPKSKVHPLNEKVTEV